MRGVFGDPKARVITLVRRSKKRSAAVADGLTWAGPTGARGTFAICHVALQHNVIHHLEGKMPDGRDNSVDLLVATIPALLVMKGYALVGRDKKKDAYDIYFSVRNYEGGPVVLAEACKPLLGDESVAMAYREIAEKFRGEDDFGPQTVRMFLADSDALGGMTPEQVQVDAFRQVQAWLKVMRLIK